MTPHRLLAWLPTEQRKPLLQRLLIVWAVSLPIAAATWMGHKSDGLPHRFEVSLVYAYAISTCIWLFTDVSRFVFKRLLRAHGPHYWPPALRASVMLLVGTPLGYVLGTLVGDAYAGWSTWDLWHFNRNRFVGLLVSTVAISAAFVAFFYQRAKAESLASQVTQAQLMLLQSQLEPHMLFNTLAHLRALIGQDTVRAHAMLDHLNDYLRTTLQASRQPVHPLSEEFSRLHDYLSLMAIRMGPRLTYSLHLPAHLGTTPVPSFILQPLVENAIRHGIEPAVHGGTIEIEAALEGAVLHLQVRNTGTPLPDTHSDGYGLAHVRERLRGLMGAQGRLTLETQANGGTCAHLHWPANPA